MNNRHFRVDYADYVDYARWSEYKNSFDTSVDNRHFRHFRSYYAYYAYYAYKMPPRTIRSPKFKGTPENDAKRHFWGEGGSISVKSYLFGLRNRFGLIARPQRVFTRMFANKKIRLRG